MSSLELSQITLQKSPLVLFVHVSDSRRGISEPKHMKTFTDSKWVFLYCSPKGCYWRQHNHMLYAYRAAQEHGSLYQKPLHVHYTPSSFTPCHVIHMSCCHTEYNFHVTTLSGRCYDYPHFIKEETNIAWPLQSHNLINWWSQDLKPRLCDDRSFANPHSTLLPRPHPSLSYMAVSCNLPKVCSYCNSRDHSSKTNPMKSKMPNGVMVYFLPLRTAIYSDITIWQALF